MSPFLPWKRPAGTGAAAPRPVEKNRLDILRGDLPAIAAWPVACTALGVLLWSLTLSKLDADHATVKQNTFQRASTLSTAYAEQLSRSVAQIDRMTLTLKYYWTQTRGGLDLQKQVREGLYPGTAHLYVTIVDRHGKRVTSTLEESIGGPSIAFRDFFQSHKMNPSGGLRIDPPQIGLRSGKTFAKFSRRLDAPDGSFDGVVVVSVEPRYLASFTESSSMGGSDFVTVRKADGTLLSAKLGENIRPLTHIFRASPTFDKKTGVVSMPGDTFMDDEPRIVGWQMLDTYPLMTAVGLSERQMEQSHQDMARSYRHMAIAGTVLLFMVAMSGLRFSTRLAWRKRQADEVKAAYRLATDGAREGFYMMRALYGPDGEVVDFLFEDCNERGAAFYGTTRERLIGTRFTEIDSLRVLVTRFHEAMRTGFYEDEVKIAPGNPLQAGWVHRRLVRSGDGLAVTLRDISESKAQEEALSRLANADALTGLPNRHWLINRLPAALELAHLQGSVLALLFVDLDDFKNINDTLGHAAGDELLRAVAGRLQSVLRTHDNVVRLGGDEFTLILEQVDSDAHVVRVAERIMAALAEPFLLSGGSRHRVHASIGISMFPQDGEDGQALLKHADIAMYAAKANGKGHFRFYQPQLSHSLVGRLDKEQALREAIERDEFELHYQPRVDTVTGRLRGMEALVRWRRPGAGLVAPLEFIGMAEETGLIVPLGELVVRKACAQLAQWRARQLPVVPVSINVSARQFGQGGLAALFASCMADYSLEASLIEIEITESCMMGEDQAVAAELAALEALGSKLLVDDFGTGYSSLSQLQRMDMDVLKVDRAFTAQLGEGGEGKALFRAILSMAHALDMSVVAEGVETVAQLRMLQELRCDEVQGYLVSRPLPAEEMVPLMVKGLLFSHVHGASDLAPATASQASKDVPSSLPGA